MGGERGEVVEDKREVSRKEDGGGREDWRRNRMTTILSHEGMEGIHFLLPKRLLRKSEKRQPGGPLALFLTFL